jgi:hypothetical protein
VRRKRRGWGGEETRGLTDCSQVDMLGLRYKSVDFGAGLDLGKASEGGGGGWRKRRGRGGEEACGEALACQPLALHSRPVETTKFILDSGELRSHSAYLGLK